MERNEDEFLEFAAAQLNSKHAQKSLEALQQLEEQQALAQQRESSESSGILDKFRSYSTRKKAAIIGIAGIGITYAFGLGIQVINGTVSTDRVICEDWQSRDNLVGQPLKDVANTIVTEQGLAADETQDVFNILINKNIGAFAPQEPAGGPLVVTKEGFDVPTDCR